MNQRIYVLFCVLAAAACAWSQDPDTDGHVGYVTRAASASDFDVNGIRVLCGPQTHTTTKALANQGPGHPGCPENTPYLGESMRIDGNKKAHAIEADLIVANPAPLGEVKGTAVIDALPESDAAALRQGNLLVRADGYFIRITTKTSIVWNSPLRSLADVKAGDWIEYKGRQDQDGSIVAESVKLSPDVVSKFESKLRTRTAYDDSPAATKKKPGKTRLSDKANPPLATKFPRYSNAEMQARIDRIGNSLIPAYQRNLLKTDPARFEFRFVLVDEKKWHDAITLPSGVILVPYQVVERLPNDAQLATVLADNIACALEKQAYRALPRDIALSAALDGAAVAGWFVPGLGVASLIEGSAQSSEFLAQSEIFKQAEDQSGRVSLGLLQDAGYDITQAPQAWWLLSAKKTKPLADIPLPRRATGLYRMLGTVWHSQPARAAPIIASAQSAVPE